MTSKVNKGAYRRGQEQRAAEQRQHGNVQFLLGGAEAILAKSRGAAGSKALKDDVVDTYMDGLRAHRRARAMEVKGKTIGHFIATAQRLSAQQQESFAVASQHYEASHLAPVVPESAGDTFERTRHDARSGKEIHETVRKPSGHRPGAAQPAPVARPASRRR